MKRKQAAPAPQSAIQPISLDVLREKYLKPGESSGTGPYPPFVEHDGQVLVD